MKTSEKLASAYKEFAEVKTALQEFIGENQEVMRVLAELTESYNMRIQAVREALQELDTNEQVKMGEFTRSARRPGTSIIPSKLPAAVLSMPGVVKTVNAQVLLAMVESGDLDANVLTQASETNMPSPTIRPPKEIVFGLEIVE